MKTCLKDDETQNAVDRVKARISPKTPCVNADAEGYCTGPCEGALCFKCADYKPATAVAVADQTATLPVVPIHLENMPALTPTESVRFDLGMAKKCGALTLAYLARAGWKLACEKEGAGHGGWLELCMGVGISPDTANRYIKFYYSTVGEHLRAQGTAHRLVENLTDSMIEEALSGLESKTATGAMIELGIVKRPAGWGGTREGAGRKAAAAAAAAGDGLDMGDSATLMWAEAMKPFEANRAAFHSAARDLNVNVASRFLEELRMLEGALAARVKGGR